MVSGGDIARYYDRNTPRFLLLGGGGGSYSVHRQLWGPGVVTGRAASDYINLLIADEIRGFGLTEPLSVLDMGCGVGGTMFRLAETFPDSRFVGITISQRQRDIAVRLNARKSLGERCRFVLGDFQTMHPGQQGGSDCGGRNVRPQRFPREFLHGRDRASAVDTGYLIVAHDFLTEDRSHLSEAARRHIVDFKAGWRPLGSLCGP